MTRADLAAELATGDTFGQIARRWGANRKTLWLRAKRWGLSHDLKPGNPGVHATWFRGEQRTLHAIAAMVGVHYNTVWRRYHKGHRGEQLARPARAKTPVPDCYDLGLSLTQWREYAALAAEIGLKAAHNRTGLPYGALSAAINEDWERLG